MIPIDRPIAVVTIFSDNSGLAVNEFETRARADLWIETEKALRGRRPEHEYRVVSLVELLAWVRGAAT